jgi:GT2 family glycosyltransferase
MQNNKIGIGLITCDRYNFLEKSLSSIFKNTERISTNDIHIVVVDDTDKTPQEVAYSKVKDILEKNFTSSKLDLFTFIKTEGKEGVGASKNKALKDMIGAGCEHIFLMEDDVEIVDPSVFDVYIKTSKITGVKHLNFALHGNHNKDLYGNFITRRVINYPDNTKLSLFPNILGAFSYYHIDTLNECGVMDEQFYNALEHVDHTYQIIKKGFHPPFRWFADVFESEKLLKDIVPDHQESKIRSQEDFVKNFFENHEKFIQKNNFSVINGEGPVENVFSEEDVVKSLQTIWKTHHDKELIGV